MQTWNATLPLPQKLHKNGASFVWLLKLKKETKRRKNWQTKRILEYWKSGLVPNMILKVVSMYELGRAICAFKTFVCEIKSFLYRDSCESGMKFWLLPGLCFIRWTRYLSFSLNSLGQCGHLYRSFGWTSRLCLPRCCAVLNDSVQKKHANVLNTWSCKCLRMTRFEKKVWSQKSQINILWQRWCLLNFTTVGKILSHLAHG